MFCFHFIKHSSIFHTLRQYRFVKISYKYFSFTTAWLSTDFEANGFIFTYDLRDNTLKKYHVLFYQIHSYANSESDIMEYGWSVSSHQASALDLFGVQ